MRNSLKNRLMQLYADNASGPRNYSVKNAGNGEASIYLYDAIGDYFGISPLQFAKDLNALDVATINLHINSPGGDVFAARAMVAAIQAHPAAIIAHIDGLAASAATYVATSASEVRMTQGAFFMIHNGWTLAMGDKREMRATADLLEKVDGSIVSDYVGKTGKDQSQIIDWMNAETWFTADEALSNGFINSINEGKAAKNSWNLAAYGNAPKALLEPDPVNDPVYDMEHLERRLMMLEQIG